MKSVLDRPGVIARADQTLQPGCSLAVVAGDSDQRNKLPRKKAPTLLEIGYRLAAHHALHHKTAEVAAVLM